MNALLQNLGQLEEALAPLGAGAAAYAGVLKRTREHLTRFAELEKRTLGHVTVPVSRHQLAGDANGIEGLARRERERLRGDHPDVLDIMHLLDRDGLKVYRPSFPPRGDLLGFFLFDQEVGPALVGDARLETPAANVVFARLFGHYLLDNDPYRIRLVLARQDPGGPAAEFAAAFLIDVDELGRYLGAIQWKKGKELGREEVFQLAIFFEVSGATVIERLDALGIPSSEDARKQAVSGPGADTPASVEPVISGRFVRLALEAHALGNLPVDELALYLETDKKTARELAGRFELPDSEARS